MKQECSGCAVVCSRGLENSNYFTGLHGCISLRYNYARLLSATKKIFLDDKFRCTIKKHRRNYYHRQCLSDYDKIHRYIYHNMTCAVPISKANYPVTVPSHESDFCSDNPSKNMRDLLFLDNRLLQRLSHTFCDPLANVMSWAPAH